MKTANVFLLLLLLAIEPVLAQDAPDTNDIVAKMKVELNLQDDQVYHITPVIEKYAMALHDLQKSIDDGTINPSVVDSQKQQIQAAEDQELSRYLRPDQISQWNYIQGQSNQNKNIDANDDREDADAYSNLPRQSGGG